MKLKDFYNIIKFKFIDPDKNPEKYYRGVISKEITGLPVNIYFDSWHCWNKVDSSYIVQIQNDISNKHHYCSFFMSIEDEPKIISGKCNLNKEILKTVKKFLSNKKDAILDYINNFDDYEELTYTTIKI